MIDTNLAMMEFIENRKIFNRENNLHPGDKKYLDEDPKLFVVTYGNGKGCYVIDQEQFYKLPKSTQNKILDMPNRRI